MHTLPRFLIAGLLLLTLSACRRDDTAQPHSLRVQLDATATQPVSGRLLVFAMPADEARAQAKGGQVTAVDTSPFNPAQVSVAAMEVAHLAPGQSIDVDLDAIAFPAKWSKLPPDEYALQAVLDVNHDYNYSGRDGGDVVSDVVQGRLGDGSVSTLTLTDTLPAREPWTFSGSAPQALRDAVPAARANSMPIDFTSPSLSAFWGRPIRMRGWVLLPPDYASQPQARYPTVYYTHGFTSNHIKLTGDVTAVDAAMRSGEMPPMIWIFLDESAASGTHEFADSVNNGPWGTALTGELIPHLESRYRMDAQASGRFLTGHSSGGWATMWLQVNYPKLFGGTWSTSPDPVDFHDFMGPDLYAENANLYRRPDGSAWPLMRDQGKLIANFEQFGKLERVLGPYGGQMASFEWVFSPRGDDGRPQPLFDRDTGKVDPAVAAYWREHYDIAHKLRTQWLQLKADLDGKIHVIVGDADTFYLDGPARRLKATLAALGAKTDVRIIPGRSHFDLYHEGDDRRALAKRIAWEMYAVARPGAVPPTP